MNKKLNRYLPSPPACHLWYPEAPSPANQPNGGTVHPDTPQVAAQAAITLRTRGWAQGKTHIYTYTPHKSISFCLVAAIEYGAMMLGVQKTRGVHDDIAQLIREQYGIRFGADSMCQEAIWNDDPETGKDDVLAILDKASAYEVISV
jgi:hypothetical protein